MKRLLFLLLPALPLLAACTDDDTPLPAYTQGLVEVVTNAEGRAARLITDDGLDRPVCDAPMIEGLTPDSIYRVLALYILTPGGVQLHGMTTVVSPRPEPFAEETFRTDPVSVTAVWRTPRYVNMHLTLRTAGGGHRFAFADRGIATGTDGRRMLTLDLYHDRCGDAEHYRRETILSCPTYDYAERLRTDTDSVRIRINTDRGVYEKRMPF